MTKFKDDEVKHLSHGGNEVREKKKKKKDFLLKIN